MDYGEIITSSFRIVLRHRYLWLLGLLAGEGAAAGFGGGQGGRTSRTGPSADFGAVTGWTAEHAALLLAIGFGVAVLAIVLFVLRCIAAGAIIRAVDWHSQDKPATLGQAWSAGVGTAWRVMGLQLFALLLALAAAVVSLGTALIAAVLAASGRAGFAAGTGIVAAVLIVCAIAFWLVLSVATTFALRAAVLDDRPALEALAHGFGLVRRRLGRSFLLWVILLVLSWLGGLVVALAAIGVALPFVGIGAAAWATAGIGPVFVTVVVLGAVVVAAVALVCAGFLGAFASTYWTLAYRRLDLEAGPAALPQPA